MTITDKIRGALKEQNIEESAKIINGLEKSGIKNYMLFRDVISRYTSQDKKVKRPVALTPFSIKNDMIVLNNISEDNFFPGSPDSLFIYFKKRVSDTGKIIPWESKNYVASIISEIIDGNEVEYLIPKDGIKIV